MAWPPYNIFFKDFGYEAKSSLINQEVNGFPIVMKEFPTMPYL